MKENLSQHVQKIFDKRKFNSEEKIECEVLIQDLEKFTFQMCNKCNGAMTKFNAETLVLQYRSENLANYITKNSEIITNKAQKDSEMKKIYAMQIFYDTDGQKVRDRADLLREWSLINIASNLFLWASYGKGQYRVLAIFFSAFLIYYKYVFNMESKSFIMDFSYWYCHVFREYYMSCFTERSWFSHSLLSIRTKIQVLQTEDIEQKIKLFYFVNNQLEEFKQEIQEMNNIVFNENTDVEESLAKDRPQLVKRLCHLSLIEKSVENFSSRVQHNVDELYLLMIKNTDEETAESIKV